MLTNQQILDHYGLDDAGALGKDPDYEALGKSIEDPIRTAVCHILDGNKKIVVNRGVPIRVHVEVPFKNYKEEIKKRSLRFIGWY